ncbi:kinase-like domain-containing protein [Dendryphion nanum]|uniref:Kinase-like domain-containing protein n=1 Tax=Dendryphion nanum TaxID=256645 RepID=A0A9P9D261_9PLEO|nr:kinase-like domain-containing protein [Dendryphion nanum]
MTEKQKRNTVFPGSDPWTGNRKRPKLVDSKDEVPSVSGLSRPLTNRLIDIPIKPLSSYGAVPIPLLEGSPWNHYQSCYSLELGGPIAVVRKISATKDLFTMHSFSSSGADKKLYMLRQLKHANLLASLEIFSFQDAHYVISEHTEVSCEEFIVARPDEIQLAAIIRQVIDAISYLVSQNLVHGSITCSNILLTKDGVIKIANYENSTERSSENAFEDVKALGQVMKQLMEKGTVKGRLGLRQPSDWSQEAVDFLSLTMTASPTKLAEHPFLENSPQCHELVWLVSLAQRTAYWFYSVSARAKTRTQYKHAAVISSE